MRSLSAGLTRGRRANGQLHEAVSSGRRGGGCEWGRKFGGKREWSMRRAERDSSALTLARHNVTFSSMSALQIESNDPTSSWIKRNEKQLLSPPISLCFLFFLGSSWPRLPPGAAAAATQPASVLPAAYIRQPPMPRWPPEKVAHDQEEPRKKKKRGWQVSSTIVFPFFNLYKTK
jgi:hypothetical protein